MPPPRQNGFIPVVFILRTGIFLFILGNLLYLDYRILSTNKPSLVNPVPHEVPKEIPTPIPSVCGQDCKDEIAQQIKNIKNDLATDTAKVSVKPVVVDSQGVQVKELFIPIGGSGSTKELDWVGVNGTEFTLDTSNYPNYKAIYFQASLQTDAPDRSTFVRLFDIDHSVGVARSDITSIGMTSTQVESLPIIPLSSKTKMKIQIHGLNGNQAMMFNPRLRVVF